MSVEGHVEALRRRHADLERRIEEEQGRPVPDTTKLHQLKRDKLHVKEELDKLGG